MVLQAQGLVRLTAVSSEWRYPIDGSMGAAEAIATIFRTLQAVMAANAERLSAGPDVEALHDYRVAVRRTRSALSLYDPAIPARVARRSRKLFKDLGRRTNAARDLDALLLALPDYAAALTPGERPGLGGLEARLAREGARQHAAIRRWLTGKTYARAVAVWRADLVGLEDRPGGGAIATLAAGAIEGAFGKVLQQIEAVRGEGSSDAIHRLRIRCKKLRYALEFASSLTAGGEAEGFITSLKVLQDELGTHQDLAVHRKWLAQTRGRGDVEVAATRARDRLVQVLVEREVRLRDSILEDVGAFHGEAARDLSRVLSALG